MTRIRPLVLRTTSALVCLLMANMSMPLGVVYTVGTPIRMRIVGALEEAARSRWQLAARRAASSSRPLSASEQCLLQGRLGENPYAAGQAKWDVVVDGINMVSLNFTTSATDLSFEGGYGIPVNVTRSYSANNPDEGPFGKGWTLSADVRTTAGGLIKSNGAPVRSVATFMRERPTQQHDPNAMYADGLHVDPLQAATVTSADGQEETVQRDVDGVLTTPPWDKNCNLETTYEVVVGADGNTYKLMATNETATPDGTVYHYSKHGTYLNGGTIPWYDYYLPANQRRAPEPSNVLKVDWVEDRNGNRTTYTYGDAVTFAKSNGTVSEDKLMAVSMKNGRTITLTWNGNRIESTSDGVRTVEYGYAGGLLTSVTSPGGRTTAYEYAPAVHATSFSL